jgi:hypothetical protein
MRKLIRFLTFYYNNEVINYSSSGTLMGIQDAADKKECQNLPPSKPGTSNTGLNLDPLNAKAVVLWTTA